MNEHPEFDAAKRFIDRNVGGVDYIPSFSMLQTLLRYPRLAELLEEAGRITWRESVSFDGCPMRFMQFVEAPNA